MAQSYGNALTTPQSDSMNFDSTFHRGFNRLYRQEHFPFKLYRLLEEAHEHGQTHVISWSADGLSFIIHQPKVFANTLMKSYFKHTKYKSFQRQMNLYQFVRTPRDGVLGIYSHPLFRRGYEILCKDIRRPSKNQQNVLFARKQEKIREPIADKALLTHIVPLERNSNTTTSSISFCRVVTDNDSTATGSNASLSSMSISQQSNGLSNDYHEQIQGKMPLQMIATTTTTSSNSLEFDPLVTRSSEFNLFDGFRRNPSLFHFQEDDDRSMGTIDDFSNIHAIG